MRRKSILILVTMTVMLFLSGCGDVQAGEQAIDTEMTREESSDTAVEDTNATSEVQSTEQAPLTLEEQIAEQEFRMGQGLFAEADYAALAKLYEQAGAQEAQRATIYRALRLYPSEDYIAMLSEMLRRVYEPDEEMQGVLAELEGYWADEDMGSLKSLINGEKWKLLFGGELEVITGRTLVLNGEVRYQVVSDALETRVTAFYPEGKVKDYITNAEGSKYLDATLKDGSYEGDFTYVFLDSADKVQSRYEGTLQGGHCVGELTILSGGTTYSGEFDEDGTTKEKQIEKVTKKNRLIYAYNAKKTKYLYETDVKASDWTLAVEQFAFPIIEEW